jgi:hypothetical protein
VLVLVLVDLPLVLAAVELVDIVQTQAPVLQIQITQ